MKRHRFNLWFLPPIGLIIGYIIAFMFMNGLFVTWQSLGNPSEDISRIIGLSEHGILMSARSGDYYSLNNFQNNLEKPLHRKDIVWIKQPMSSEVYEPYSNHCSRFISWPPIFKVKQQFKLSVGQIEGINCYKFVLDMDGNIWSWNYATGGFIGFVYYIFPFIGALGGLIIALLIKAGLWSRSKIKTATPPSMDTGLSP